MNAPWKIVFCLCIKHSAEEKPCYCVELEKDMIYIRMRWTNNIEQYCNILLYITFRFGCVHLQHSNVSKLNTVCALHYKVYCAYTPSNGAMALLNKISVFRILLTQNVLLFLSNCFSLFSFSFPLLLLSCFICVIFVIDAVVVYIFLS